MTVHVRRDHPTLPAPAGVSDGGARFEQLATPSAPSRVGVLHVHFPPGARTRWHTHPLGQLLVVTSGRGWVQSRGGPPRPISTGDVVRIEPAEEHWHGAAHDTAMSHLAVQERDDDGAETTVLETVTDDPRLLEEPA